MPKEIGKTGLAEFSGQIQEDFLRELRGKEAYKKYNEMRLNSPVIGAMLLAIEQAIRKVSWQFVSENEEDPRTAFLDEAIKAMSHSWNDHIADALTMLAFGHSIFEIVYQRIDGRLVWRKFAFRGQDTVLRWRFDDTGGLKGFEQQTVQPIHSAFIPIEKMVLYRTRVEKQNPEGRSVLRTAWIPYYYSKHIQQIEAIGIERDLNGLPVITLPPNATTDTSDANSDASKAEKLVRNIRNDEQAGLVLPEGWIFELATTNNSSKAITPDTVIQRHESRTLMSALAQFLMLGQESTGSLALSRDQTDFFTMSVNSVADVIGETFSKYAIPRLLILNGMDPDGIMYEHSPAGDVDIAVLSEFLQKMAPMLTWLPEDEVWLRQAADLPDVDIERLEEEREAREEKAMAIQQSMGRPKDKDDDGDDRDDMGAGTDGWDRLRAGASDDSERTKQESIWTRTWQRFFRRQKKRVEDGLRESLE